MAPPFIKKITFSSLTPDSGAYKDAVTIIGTNLVSQDKGCAQAYFYNLS